MVEKNAGRKRGKIKKFLARLTEKIDKKLEEKSENNKNSCCGGGNNSGKNQCCK